MAKRREVDRGDVPDIDQVLLELFAGQLLLERAAGSEAPVLRPAASGRPRSAATAATMSAARSSGCCCATSRNTLPTCCGNAARRAC